MRPSDILWEIFTATGHVGIYLLYKQHQKYELKAGLQDREIEVSREGQPNSVIG